MLVEALTQRAADRDRPLMPETLPPPFGEIARQCLILDPQHRYTAHDILAKLSGNTPALEAAEIETVISRARRPPGDAFLYPRSYVGLVILALLAITRLLNRPETQPPPSARLAPPKVEPKPEPPAPRLRANPQCPPGCRQSQLVKFRPGVSTSAEHNPGPLEVQRQRPGR